MKMDVKTQLHEGMKIAPLDNQEKQYSLIVSNVDNEMYGVSGTHIIKLNDIDEDELDSKWICTNLSYLAEDIECIEFEKDIFASKMKIVSFEDFCIYSFVDLLDDEIKSIDMKKTIMKREKYLLLKGMNYEIKIRDIVAEEYLKQIEALKNE